MIIIIIKIDSSADYIILCLENMADYVIYYVI